MDGLTLGGVAMKRKFFGLIAAITLFFGIPAGTPRAATVLGDVISGSYNFPCATCVDVGGFGYFFNPFVVNGSTGAVETTLFIGNPVSYSAWTVDFVGNSVTLTMAPAPLTNASYTADPFNGPVFTVLSGNLFGSVTDVITNLHCTPCNPVTAFVSGNSLFINWQGAGGQVGDTVTVGFTAIEPIATPLPGALPLFATGLAALSLLGWRRQRKNLRH